MTEAVITEQLPEVVRLAIKQNNLTFQGHSKKKLGNTSTIEYRFNTPDGRAFSVDKARLSRAGWPKNLDQFITKQRNTLGLNSAANYDRVKAMAGEAGAKLHETAWHGADHWYSFTLPTGRVVQIRGGKLIERGWPEDIDAYLTWSAARKSKGRARLSAEGLLDEFRNQVRANGGTVLTNEWLGARVPHEVQLSDGTTRWLKPNQLKYIGWPAVPLDELRKRAGSIPVEIVPGTATLSEQLFYVALAGKFFLKGSYYPVKHALESGVVEQVAEGVQWAESQGLRSIETEWAGPTAEYPFLDAQGNQVLRMMPCGNRVAEDRNATLHLGYVRRSGNRVGYTLVSTEWRGRDATYEWTSPSGGKVRKSVSELQALVDAEAHFVRLTEHVTKLGYAYNLAPGQTWQGKNHVYRWLDADGKTHEMSLSFMRSQHSVNTQAHRDSLPGNLSELLKSGAEDGVLLHALRTWGGSMGLALQTTRWRGPFATYVWRLPSGAELKVAVKKLQGALGHLLRYRSHKQLTDADCRELQAKFA